MVVGSRLGFGVTTVALVALASTGTAVLVSHGTNQLHVPGYRGAPRTTQALPGVAAPIVVPRVPGTLAFPAPPISLPVIVPVNLPVVTPPRAPSQPAVVPAPPAVKPAAVLPVPRVVVPPVVAPPVASPPVAAPQVLPPPIPAPPVMDPRVKHPQVKHSHKAHKTHKDNGKHLGQLKH